MSALSMQNIVHSFDDQKVLNTVSFEVPSGKVACLLGPSGCGKTTLLRIAAGLEPLQAGTVSIDGHVVSDGKLKEVPPEKRNIGLMFQDYALFPHLNVAENIIFGIKSSGNAQRTWVKDALVRMGMTGFAERYPHELSGGQQQRVALLRALAPEPSILLLDEPFSGLDITRRAQVREQTLELLRETGHTALMVTHDPEEAMFMSDTLLVMNNGLLVQSGGPVEIYKHPQSAFVAELFGDTNTLQCICESPGILQTPFGPVEAPELDAGHRAEVIIRAEGIVLDGTDARSALTADCVVTRTYPTGRSTQLRLTLDRGDGDPIPLHARVPGILVLEPGSRIEVSVDPDHMFVFPADG